MQDYPTGILKFTQTESEEDEKFMDLFNDNIELLDASFGTDSGLYMAEEKSYPVKLYKMSGKTRVNAVLVSVIL